MTVKIFNMYTDRDIIDILMDNPGHPYLYDSMIIHTQHFLSLPSVVHENPGKEASYLSTVSVTKLRIILLPYSL